MDKVTTQIKDDVLKKIDSLELGEFKELLVNDLKFNYKLSSFESEDYSKLGNSRLGGIPDLPFDIPYPVNEYGYFNLLCQINFSEFENKFNKLPKDGILYVFDGHSSENDFVTIFTKSTNNLIRKAPPIELSNLNDEIRNKPYKGLKANFSIEHYFGIASFEVYKYDKYKYKDLIKLNSRYKSHILGESHEDKCYIYLSLKGFDTLVHDVLLYKGIRKDYESQLNHYLKECEEGIEADNSKSDYYHRKKIQLNKLDSEKEIHFENYENITCLVGLESLDELQWVWGDMGYKYVYILNEDLENSNFDNLFVQTWSS